MTKFETVEGPKTREKVTVWMGLSNHGVFGSHSFENEDAKGNTIRTENNIAIWGSSPSPQNKTKT